MSEKEAVEKTDEKTEQERYDALSGNEKMNHLLRSSGSNQHSGNGPARPLMPGRRRSVAPMTPDPVAPTKEWTTVGQDVRRREDDRAAQGARPVEDRTRGRSRSTP